MKKLTFLNSNDDKIIHSIDSIESHAYGTSYNLICFLLTLEINDCNVKIDGRNFLDQWFKNI